MGKLNTIWSYFARHKYLITLFIGLLVVGVVDENSFRKYFVHQLRINELNEEIESYADKYERDSAALSALMRGDKGVERIARERYHMKRPNEDVYIMREE